MKDVVIIDGVRSAIGKYGGGLAGVRPDDLLGEVYKGLVQRTGIDPAAVTDAVATTCGTARSAADFIEILRPRDAQEVCHPIAGRRNPYVQSAVRYP